MLQANTILIDKIAAVVDDEIITLTDIDKAIQVYPLEQAGAESGESFYIEVLHRLIAHKTVYLEYKDELKLTEEDYAAVQRPIIEKFGSLEKLLALLKRFDMDWADFKDFIKEKVVYEKVLKEKFLDEIKIDYREIETFYNREYVPRQQGLNLKVKNLVEMAPLIEKELKENRAEEKSFGWLQEIETSYHIINKLQKESK